MITLARFRLLEAALRRDGYGYAIDWSETIGPAEDADDFAARAIYVICNSGMKASIAAGIFDRWMAALRQGQALPDNVGHDGKRQGAAIIWQQRESLLAAYIEAEDPVAFLEQLPWIGPVTRHHLAKNLGIDDAKPDVHLERLARRAKTTTHKLCARLARQTGYRMSTIDTILWRACADGYLNSAVYEAHGWAKAIAAVVVASAQPSPSTDD